MHYSKIATLLVMLVACSSSDDTTSSSSSSSGSSGNTQTMMIGPEGGAIVVGGATVTFPKDAVAAPTQITISEDTTVPEGFVTLSHLFKCEPSGTSFAKPVTMQMPFVDDQKGPATIFWSSGADPTFKDLGGTVQGSTMITNVEHFSSGFVGRKK